MSVALATQKISSRWRKWWPAGYEHLPDSRSRKDHNMSFCQSCGAAFADGTTFCPKCSVRPQAMAAPAAANSGLTANTAGALAYLAGIVTGILFLVIDPYKSDRFVRFHAFQSIFFNVAWIALWIAWMIVGLVLGAISHGLFFIIQLPINLLVTVGGFCIWIYLMYSAYQGKTFQLPVIGALAATQAGIAPAATGQRL